MLSTTNPEALSSISSGPTGAAVVPEAWSSDLVRSPAIEGPAGPLRPMGGGHVAWQPWDPDRDSDWSGSGGESSLLFVFLDFIECCFKKRASAGRATGAGRFSGFALTSDCTSD